MAVFAAAALAVLVAASLTAVVVHRDAGHVITGAGADFALPGSTLSDWVSYADYVVEAVATEATMLPPTEQDLQQGLSIRMVSMTVDSVVWRSASPTHEPPSTFSMDFGGWTHHKGQPVVPFRMADAVKLEIGHTYLLPLVYGVTSSGWEALGPYAILPFDSQVVGHGETILGASGFPSDPMSEPGSARAELWNRGLSQAKAVIESAKPDRIAAQYAELSPVERYHKVLEEKHRLNPPTPGPGEK
ncbi:MAG TPA: hypothetical protein VIQ26_02235 [Microbacteriaceae bacterium]